MSTTQSSQKNSQKNSLTIQYNLDFEKFQFQDQTSYKFQHRGGPAPEAPTLDEAVAGWYWQVLHAPAMSHAHVQIGGLSWISSVLNGRC